MGSDSARKWADKAGISCMLSVLYDSLIRRVIAEDEHRRALLGLPRVAYEPPPFGGRSA